MGRTDGKEPRLEIKPLTRSGWRVLMCLQVGELRFCVQREPQVGGGVQNLSVYLNKIPVAKAWREQGCSVYMNHWK